MNINQATDYAFRAILFLAGQPKGAVVEAKVIAKREFIPMRFLLKNMPLLIKAGIIKSQRGVGGGYILAKNLKDISFLDVVQAIEGPININRCLEDYSFCTKNAAPKCKVHQTLAGIQEKLVNELKKHNIAELI